MYQNKFKTTIIGLLLLTCASFFLSLKQGTVVSEASGHLVTYFKASASDFAVSSVKLKDAVALVDKGPRQIEQAKQALMECRLQYKKIEFFLSYFFKSSSLIYNQPAKVEVEEPYMEYQEPSGFQVIEALLFEEHPELNQKALEAQAGLISSSAGDLDALSYQFEASDPEILESVRLELVRVMAFSISGYDAPELKSGIREAGQSITAITSILKPFLRSGVFSKKVSVLLEKSEQYLSAHPDFDHFDRMEFLRTCALPLQEQLGNMIRGLKMEMNSQSALNYGSRNLFSKDALSRSAFSGAETNDQKIAALGKRLFFEKALSGNLKRNCASCHQPSKYFTDGIKTSQAFEDGHHLTRNAPTLLYAGAQYAQFWDGRAKRLQEQIKMVIRNPQEMNGDHAVVIGRLNRNKDYPKLTIDGVADAIAAYIYTLEPFNSAFDQYLDGNDLAMNKKQINGFNLFMGKAQCGTCHFVPLFNGLIPPYYKRTEFEILGVPSNDDLKHPKKDTDLGRMDYFPIDYYQFAFKTPTVRNVAMTAPYMHNGVFNDLQKVMEFYNEGGGTGIGLDLPGQTLSAKPLHLSQNEIDDVIEFLKTLTDLPVR